MKLLKLTKRSLIFLLASWLAFLPTAQGQESIPTPNNDSDQTLFDLAESLDALFGQPALELNQLDKQAWQDLASKSTESYDRRIMTELLPYLVESSAFPSLVVDRIKRGYDTEATKQSRTIPGSTSESPHHTGKGLAISAVGLTSCLDSRLFNRGLDITKPLWVRGQLPAATNQELPGFFGRSFDRVARQFFWIEGRSFTNRPISPQSWSELLRLIGLGEIEERFGLRPGVLAATPNEQLPDRLAAQRLGQVLGVSDLPMAADNEAEFYQKLGQHQIELNLGLPLDSLAGRRQQLYQQIGWRVLETELDLPVDPSDQETPVTSSDNYLESPRFQQLATALREKARFYPNPEISLNLPNSYLSENQQSGFIDRLIIGDPRALAVAGAYFLADSLQLPSSATSQFLASVEQGEDRMIPGALIRPTDPNLRINQLFDSETTDEQQLALFEALGRLQQSTLRQNLPRLSETLLLAFNSDGKVPSLESVVQNLSNPSRRAILWQKIGTGSVEDANYSALTDETLIARGRTLLGRALNLSQTELKAVERLDESQPTNQFEATLETIDTAFDWPTGTAAKVIRGQAAITQLGSEKLWQKLDFPSQLQEALHDLYFTNQLNPLPDDSEPAEPEEETETTPSPSPSAKASSSPEGPEPDTDQSGEDPFGDETVEFSLPPEAQPLADLLKQQTSLPEEDIEYLITGRWYPGLLRLTLARVAQELNKETTVTPGQLVGLLNQPSPTQAEPFLNQREIISQQTHIVPLELMNQLDKAAKENNLYQLWYLMASELAIKQWNLTCQDKQEETSLAIERLIETLIALPNQEVGTPSDSEPTDKPPRPTQIFSYSLSDELKEKAEAAYPGMGQNDIRWGVYGGVARAWDQVLIRY